MTYLIGYNSIVVARARRLATPGGSEVNSIKYIGIYIHIPFCASKCAYCNFYSLAGRDMLMPAYQAAIIKHISDHAAQLDEYLTNTVYFGGGTPGYFGAGRLAEILGALKSHGRMLPDAEITAEVNPGGIAGDELAILKRAGLNRLSVGVQCADDRILASLGRIHTFADAEKTIKNARESGFNNISIDIIYGLPSQDMKGWTETVEKALALESEHISCYGLKLEEGTRLYGLKDSPLIPGDDDQADMYLYAIEALERSGYRQYEISNFAREGFESKHNLKYWSLKDYLGFGPGAHSYIGRKRFNYPADIDKYIESVSSGLNAVEHAEEISDDENAAEYLMLRLRTTHGISEDEYSTMTGMSFDRILTLLRKYEANGWAVSTKGRWSFTPRGFLISNALIGELLYPKTFL